MYLFVSISNLHTLNLGNKSMGFLWDFQWISPMRVLVELWAVEESDLRVFFYPCSITLSLVWFRAVVFDLRSSSDQLGPVHKRFHGLNSLPHPPRNCSPPSHLWSGEKLSSMKPAPGARKVGGPLRSQALWLGLIWVWTQVPPYQLCDFGPVSWPLFVSVSSYTKWEEQSSHLPW